MATKKTSPSRKQKPKDGDCLALEDLASSRRRRVDLVMTEARNAGLVGGPKDTIIRGRVSNSLVQAAKKRAGVTSDTELLEIALCSFALEDDFGEKFLKRAGTVDPDLPLEF